MHVMGAAAALILFSWRDPIPSKEGSAQAECAQVSGPQVPR